MVPRTAHAVGTRHPVAGLIRNTQKEVPNAGIIVAAGNSSTPFTLNWIRMQVAPNFNELFPPEYAKSSAISHKSRYRNRELKRSEPPGTPSSETPKAPIGSMSGNICGARSLSHSDSGMSTRMGLETSAPVRLKEDFTVFSQEAAKIWVCCRLARRFGRRIFVRENSAIEQHVIVGLRVPIEQVVGFRQIVIDASQKVDFLGGFRTGVDVFRRPIAEIRSIGRRQGNQVPSGDLGYRRMHRFAGLEME